jgi:branched-chain amino acid transport system ATP-binding protein
MRGLRSESSCGLKDSGVEGNCSNILEACQLCCRYGSVHVLDHVSFTVPRGAICVLLGPNGSGKSTALRAICGLLPEFDGALESGQVLLEDMDVTGWRPDRLVQAGMALAPEGRRVFPSMSVRENLEMGAFVYRGMRAITEKIEEILAIFPHLKDRLGQRAGTLSSGEQQMVSLGRALMSEPRLLLADEPTVGLSPNFVDAILDQVVEINRGGTTVLLVEQKAARALEIAHWGYVFALGRVAIQGSRESLMEAPEIRAAYLGTDSRR